MLKGFILTSSSVELAITDHSAVHSSHLMYQWVKGLEVLPEKVVNGSVLVLSCVIQSLRRNRFSSKVIST